MVAFECLSARLGTLYRTEYVHVQRESLAFNKRFAVDLANLARLPAFELLRVALFPEMVATTRGVMILGLFQTH